MPETSSQLERSPNDRRRLASELLKQALEQRLPGQPVDTVALRRRHADLQPELDDELAKLALIAAAREAASRQSNATSVEDDDDAREQADGLPVNHTLQGYRLVRRIGAGGQATVFEGVHERTGRRVAVKVMPEGDLASPDRRTRFDREVAILAAIDHPGIVKVIDRGQTEGGAHFLVMDYVSGQPLDQWLAKYYDAHPTGPPAEDPCELLRLFMAICDAVQAAHTRGVVHRDLKPSNILIDDRGTPRVVDFGLAHLPVSPGGDAITEPLTLTGRFLGSLPWASPEQAVGTGAEIDARSEVYSPGVILYQMLTGVFPYKVAGTRRDVMDNILNARPTPPSHASQAGDPPPGPDGRRSVSVKHGNGRINAQLDAIVLSRAIRLRGPHRRWPNADPHATPVRGAVRLDQRSWAGPGLEVAFGAAQKSRHACVRLEHNRR